MSEYDVALVGTGVEPAHSTREGVGMAERHAAAFEGLRNCSLVACVDAGSEHGERLADAYAIPGRAVFEDYATMLAVVEPDVVSIRAPWARPEVIVDAARSDGLEAIHCTPPTATTLGEVRRMAEVCAREGVALTFDLWRRFGDVFRDAKALLDDGAIGDLQRVECSCEDFSDDGTVAIDLCHYFNDGRATEWVVGQFDYRGDGLPGGPAESQMIATWQYVDGVYGMAATGTAASMTDGDWRLVGEDGFIDVHATDEFAVRVRGANGNTEKQYDALATGRSCVDRTIAEVIDAHETGRTSELSADALLDATDVVLAGYESVRRRGRVDLPLNIDDDPRQAMVSAGTLDPQPSDD